MGGWMLDKNFSTYLVTVNSNRNAALRKLSIGDNKGRYLKLELCFTASVRSVTGNPTEINNNVRYWIGNSQWACLELHARYSRAKALTTPDIIQSLHIYQQRLQSIRPKHRSNSSDLMNAGMEIFLGVMVRLYCYMRMSLRQDPRVWVGIVHSRL